MMISTGNLKGGCGCSTVLLLLAHHLSYCGEKVYLIDLNTQGSLTLLYQRSLLLQEKLPFEFFNSDEHKAATLIKRLIQDNSSILIDAPKQNTSPKLLQILRDVDCFIIPFQYVFTTLHASVGFSLLSKKLAADSKSIFLPNNNLTSDFPEEFWEQQESLRAIGKLSSAIPPLAPLINLRSMQLPPACLFELAPSLNLLCERYLF